MPAGTKTMSRRTRTERLRVDFALQGGGAHGACTRGVPDRLLEEPRPQIEGISGIPAGSRSASFGTAASFDIGPLLAGALQ